jgi:pimeloyl-ACP methyl ester carboxylesterase
MKHFVLCLALILVGSACSDPIVETLGDGHYSGVFSHGNFSDRIAFEIIKDSLEWKAFFTSLEQNAFQIPTRKVTVKGDSIHFMLQSDRYTYAFRNKWNGDRTTLTGLLLVDTLSVPYELQKDERHEIALPDIEEVNFESNGLQLGGTIWNPAKPIHKGLIFITSSGGADRSGSRAEAQYFADKGYTTFHYDKRGTGLSEGDWQAASMEELLSDDQNAIACFVAKTGIPLEQIGIKGSSQGGAKVPYLLAKLPELQFGISVSCPGSTLLESDLNAWKNEHAETLGSDLENAAGLQRQVFEHIAGILPRPDLERALIENRSQPWFSQIWVPDLEEVQTDPKLLYGPLPYFEHVLQPLLLVQGTRDEIIPLNSARVISAALDRAGNDRYQVVLLQDADHAMYYAGESDFPYWAKLHPDYLTNLEHWLDTFSGRP